MSRRLGKIVYRASWREAISANSWRESFSTATPLLTSNLKLTLLVIIPVIDTYLKVLVLRDINGVLRVVRHREQLRSLSTSRLSITNRGKPASDHFRLADNMGVRISFKNF
jgi:hypothetical protein